MISGNAGSIEATIDPPQDLQRKVVAVCCHPHPLHGGAMTNKVIHTVARTLAGLGITAVRFNFRGVGATEGVHDYGQGEQEDLVSVIEWAKQQYPDYQLWLAGFSFGSWITALQAHRHPVTQLISIAPPVNRFSFDDFIIPDCPWLVVQGDADEVVDPEAVFDWLNNMQPRPTLVKMQGAGHFFHSRLIELRDNLEQQLSEHLPPLVE